MYFTNNITNNRKLVVITAVVAAMKVLITAALQTAERRHRELYQ